MDEIDDPEVVVQPALPEIELPDFEGLKPMGVISKVNGAGQRIVRAMHLEERIVLVVEAEVSNVGHASTDDGVKRIHTLKVKDLYEMQGKPGKRLLSALKHAYRLADDARTGRVALADIGVGMEGVTVVTDGDGIVLSPGEIAAIRGIDLSDDSQDAVVLVLDDGTRALWPDDWTRFEEWANGPRPTAGDMVPKPSSKPTDPVELVVAEVLDVDTGETLSAWTAEQETARLKQVEEQLAQEEARLDREAAEELEAGRASKKSKAVVPDPEGGNNA